AFGADAAYAARHVATCDPPPTGRNAYRVGPAVGTDLGAAGGGALAMVVAGPRCIDAAGIGTPAVKRVDGVVPVVVVTDRPAVPAPVLLHQGLVAPAHTGILPGHHDAFAGHPGGPHLRRADACHTPLHRLRRP